MLKHVYWTGYRDDPNHMCNAFFVSALQLSFYRFLLLSVFLITFTKRLVWIYHSKKNIRVFKIF